MLEQFEQRLVQDEGNARPPAFHSGANFSTAAAPPTSHTLGTKRVLVIRVDFSDRPGAPFAVEFGQAIMDFSVRPFFQTSSYGQTTLLSTITPKVYRLPRTAVSYAVSAAEYDLHRDAVAAAAADFPVGTFDRVIVAFNHIGSSQIPGSQINFGGSGMVGGSEIWINGSFTFGIVAHELGHTYGLLHANLWQVNDGNPLSSTGKSSEYGDPFDIMGSGGTDVRFDFNMFEKNRLGWLPDQRVKTITASGTHRVYRFDHKDALALNQPLALRVARDGTRSYWIGLRQNFPGNASLTNGAYILWGYDSARPTDLLDLTTPGTNTDDAALALGRTFTDPAYGITFRVIARGGADVATFLDLEITIPATAPNNVVGWDGLQTVPPGITNVRAVAADDSHVLALKHDGTVVSWWVGGEPFAVPAGITNVASIAVGSGSSGVVKTDGTVHLWGNLFTSFAPPPSGLTGIRQLAIGGFHALALKYDGSVIVWGSNDSGQSSLPTGLNQVVAIAAGSRTSFALKADGTVVRWGATYPDEIPLPPGLKNVIGIAAYSAGRHLLALKPDGTVVAAGENVVGQSDVPSALNQVVAIAPGYSTSLALRADGTVAMWGNRGSFSPPPANLPRVFGIATNSNGSLALTGTGAFVLTQPESTTVASGSSTSLNVTVSAVGAATYQWRKDGSAIGGATDATLTLANPNPTDAGFYDVVVTTPTNATTSMPARLAVVAPLVIARQPLPQAVELGARADFSVEATGSGPVTFQWRRNGSPIVGATANGLSFGSVTMEDAAVYDVLLTDGVSTLSSRAVELSAFATTRLANLSIRGTTGTGPQTLIVGFVLGGQPPNAAKPLLLRGAGPALAVFGVRDPLADPKIELYRDTTRIGENDNWAGSAQVTAVGSQVGAFAFPTPSSRDAALYSDTLPAGAYTLQATSVDRAAGVVLAEIYDATPSNAFGAKTQRLVNLSARTFVGTSDSVLIAGFSISGGRNKTVLIRGVGPALAGLGVGGALADPKLELFSSTTAKLQENDNWSGSSVLAGTFRTVGAFPLLEDSKDAALLATLEPGSYTVQVSGVGGTTGVALVEIYEVP
jgi:M6 family metalloprotease-like protein